MKRIRRKGKFSVECKSKGQEKEFRFLTIRYSDNYFGQIMLQDPEETIPVIMKALNTELRNIKEIRKLNEQKEKKK